MANFTFGHIGAAIEAGQHANANLNLGPVTSAEFSLLGSDFTSFVTNADRIQTIQGSSKDFIWGQRWGNSKTRVSE